MPAGRVAMRRVREGLRLGVAGISKHEIARRTGLASAPAREMSPCTLRSGGRCMDDRGAPTGLYPGGPWTRGPANGSAGPPAARGGHGAARGLTVPDSATPAVIKACRYEPAVNRTYPQRAAH